MAADMTVNVSEEAASCACPGASAPSVGADYINEMLTHTPKLKGTFQRGNIPLNAPRTDGDSMKYFLMI